MHNYRTLRVDPESLKVNQRIVQRHMDDEHYVRWIDPELIVPDTDNSGVGPPVHDFYGLRSRYVEFPDSGTPHALWGLPVPEQWKKGVIQTTIFYAGSLGSTNGMSFTLRGGRIKIGTNLSNHGFVSTGATTITGPAVADLEESHTFSTTVSITQEHHRITWVLNRNVGDAYTGVVRLTAIRHRYVPAQHMAGGKAVP